MARMISKMFSKRVRSESARAAALSPEAREHMIGEAAYYRYVRRGFEPGHELEDWLAAEADFERTSQARQAPEPAPVEEYRVQQSGTFGAAEDDVIKRMLKRNPRRDIARIESVEPEEAPLKE